MVSKTMTDVRVLNWLIAGRGQGFGPNYCPWLQITRQDHASIGQSHILPNPYIGRQHHFLSSLERSIGVKGMAHHYVSDIREQYPTWPFPHQSPLKDLGDHRGIILDGCDESAGTVAIARELGIRHARFVGLKIPYIYTTDQLLTIDFPGRQPFLVALSVKYWSDLRGNRSAPQHSKNSLKKARRRKFQKLRLEREYWRQLGVPWGLMTDRQVHPQVYENLEWALSGVLQRIREEDIALLKRFLWAWQGVAWQGRCLDEMKAIAQVLSVNIDTAIRLLKLAVFRSLLPVDLTRPIHLQLPLPRGQACSPGSLPAWSHLRQIRGLV
jgi:hypothetical protein